MNPKLQNTFTQKVTQSKPVQIECDACHKIFYLANAVERKTFTNDKKDIIEIGLTCPHCKVYFHSYYTNDKLESRVKAIKNNRQRRAFQRDFDKWQVEVKEMLSAKLEVENGEQSK